MNAVENEVRELIEKELAAANERFPQFRSAHEGYAVLLEEVDEANDEMQQLHGHMEVLWLRIKQNLRMLDNTERIYDSAVYLACEAIQIAAMARKFMDMIMQQRSCK